MTREEAIDILKNTSFFGSAMIDIDIDIAIQMAIKAIEQESCDDTVSRHVLNAIKALPSVTPKEKTGKWILTIEDWNKWTCSKCGFTKRTDIHVALAYNYCPNCGIKMVEQQKSEDEK